MKNPEFDTRYMTLDHLVILREIEQGKTHMRNGIPWAMRRGLVEENGLYAVKLTPRGQLAVRGVFHGGLVRITRSHHLPQWWGKTGTVLGIHNTLTDSDGWDEFGYQNRWAKPTFRIDVKPDGETGTWCFYKAIDLEGIFLTGQ